jgi:hypothetical protein
LISIEETVIIRLPQVKEVAVKLEIADGTGTLFVMYADGNVLLRRDLQKIAAIGDLLRTAERFIADCRDTKPIESTLLDGVLHPSDTTHINFD